LSLNIVHRCIGEGGGAVPSPVLEIFSGKMLVIWATVLGIKHCKRVSRLVDIAYTMHYAHPFLIYFYGIIALGNTYSATLNPLYLLQKKTFHPMTFSKFDEYSKLLFQKKGPQCVLVGLYLV